jgi:hypothetical protein
MTDSSSAIVATASAKTAARRSLQVRLAFAGGRAIS